MTEFNNIIKKICEEENINLTFLSDNWLMVLEKNNKIRYIEGYKFDLNSHALGNILDDKGLFFDLLSLKHLPIIEHFVIFNNYDKKKVRDYFYQHNQKIVVKGNSGTCGLEVFKVENEEELFNVIDKLFLKEFSISLCPFYDIKNEYRVIVLNNEARIIYGKEKPKVVGDGKSTLQELAFIYNDFYKKNSDMIHNSHYVPTLGEEVELNFQFNLSRGAKMFLEINSDLKSKIISLALLVAKTCNIKFGSVDIINTYNNRLLVMEANSGVMMDNYIRFNGEVGYHDAYNLYKDAVNLMFQEQ